MTIVNDCAERGVKICSKYQYDDGKESNVSLGDLIQCPDGNEQKEHFKQGWLSN